MDFSPGSLELHGFQTGKYVTLIHRLVAPNDSKNCIRFFYSFNYLLLMRSSTPFVANDVNYVNVYCNIHG